MAQKIQSVKGMNDLLPVEQKDFKLTAAYWQAFENQIQKWTRKFGYSQIRTPIVEQTGLFVRSIGEETDVVGKEMYTFSDSNDTLSLTLRPEGTASCLRAVWNTICCTMHRANCGTWAQCSAVNAHKKDVTANFIKSALKRWVLRLRTLTRKSSRCVPICGANWAFWNISRWN